MAQSPEELWHAWQHFAGIKEQAEAWITKPAGEWTDEDEQLYALFDSLDVVTIDPGKALSVLFAITQLTDDPGIVGMLGAGPMEDFLARHGETYVDVIHALALKHRCLREVLENVWEGSMPKNVWHRIEILKQSRFS
jgi:hypothetical protein